MYPEFWKRDTRSRGPEGYNTLLATTNLAAVLEDESQFAEAEKLGRTALETERRKLGDDNPLTIYQRFNLGVALCQLSRGSEAEKLLKEAIERQPKVFGPDNPQTALFTYAFGACAALDGHRDQAFALIQAAVERGLDSAALADIEKDSDLKSLHNDPRFAAIVISARQRSATQPLIH
jgi:tetratricopeptide (TPR) repeat protein